MTRAGQQSVFGVTPRPPIHLKIIGWPVAKVGGLYFIILTWDERLFNVLTILTKIIKMLSGELWGDCQTSSAELCRHPEDSGQEKTLIQQPGGVLGQSEGERDTRQICIVCCAEKYLLLLLDIILSLYCRTVLFNLIIVNYKNNNIWQIEWLSQSCIISC